MGRSQILITAGIAMSNPTVRSCRRIEGLKQLAYDCGFTSDDARAFGKLTKTSTWEALLDSHNLEYERATKGAKSTTPPIAIGDNSVADYINDGSNPVCDYSAPTINFFEWVDLSQFVALVLATVGLFLLVTSLLPSINPFNLCPVTIQFSNQSGAKK